jgi:DNA modification methylase
MLFGDTCEMIHEEPSDSVDFTIFSPPFSSLYIYSDSNRDMGNSADDEQFFEHFRFMLPELYRITRPGRLVAIHCKDLVYYRNQRGTAGLRDFPGDVTREMVQAGFDYHSKITIWKDPVTEMQRTKAHGLLHKQLCADSTFSRQGLPDFLVIYRKWANEEESSEIRPVRREEDWRRFTFYIGDDGPETPLEDNPRAHSIEVWQRYASPVWFDINQMNVLNTRLARDSKDEKHICPLQLDVIERAIHLWTNPEDLVFDPFAGIGSAGVAALKLGRRFLGMELKESYWREAAANCKHASTEHQPQLEFMA